MWYFLWWYWSIQGHQTFIFCIQIFKNKSNCTVALSIILIDILTWFWRTLDFRLVTCAVEVCLCLLVSDLDLPSSLDPPHFMWLHDYSDHHPYLPLTCVFGVVDISILHCGTIYFWLWSCLWTRPCPRNILNLKYLWSFPLILDTHTLR